MVNYRILPEAELREYTKSLNLDPSGPVKTLIDRITRSLKLKPNAAKKRHKKAKTARIVTGEDEPEQPDQIQVEIEVVPEQLVVSDPNFNVFSDVAQKFFYNSQRKINRDLDEEDPTLAVDIVVNEEDSDLSADDYEERISSKKKLKKLNRIGVAELKSLVRKPDCVEWVDVTSPDPFLLITLKTVRNSVPVPTHWSQRRKFLQGKRGAEKIPFELPSFIADTGIMELRDIGAKNRNKFQAKMGRMDIDYQKLHDAFFKYQVKPKMQQHGSIYYEGKEFSTSLSKVPGVISEELKIALNIPPGAPVPWLMHMQRYGPPQSYPQLKIPGLNCAPPAGSLWGYHPGGWGKPPVDEAGHPIYGDVFGVYLKPAQSEFTTTIDRTLWGELDPEVEQDEESGDEASSTHSVQNDAEDTQMEDVPISEAAMEIDVIPQFDANIIDLRQSNIAAAATIEKPLFTVLGKNDQSITGFMGSSHVYDMASVNVEGTDDLEMDDTKKIVAQPPRGVKDKKHKDFKF